MDVEALRFQLDRPVIAPAEAAVDRRRLPQIARTAPGAWRSAAQVRGTP